MLRFASILRAASLDTALKNVQHVWNFHWDHHPTTHEMNFLNSQPASIPMFNILSFDGEVVNKALEPQLPQELCVKIIENMVRMNTADKVFIDAQRQGRISFYMSSIGEEGESTASVAALDPMDEIYMQYREAPVCMYRGMSFKEMISQCMGNNEDCLKGRQMPIHYGSRKLHIQQVSSPLSTQIPHAAGAGYVFRLENNGKIACCYFGDGAASEGDFAVAMNMAAVRKSHTLFICRNNGFAISTLATSQYHGDGITPRGVAYGIPSLRVDGDDVLAVYAATKRARQMIIEEDTPVLLETISYRCGDHSTSDDSSAYRTKDEIKYMEREFCPIARFGKYLQIKGWWNPEREEKLRAEVSEEIRLELSRQEKVPTWPLEELFTDTFKEIPPNLAIQKRETIDHYSRWKDTYGTHF